MFQVQEHHNFMFQIMLFFSKINPFHIYPFPQAPLWKTKTAFQPLNWNESAPYDIGIQVIDREIKVCDYPCENGVVPEAKQRDNSKKAANVIGAGGTVGATAAGSGTFAGSGAG